MAHPVAVSLRPAGMFHQSSDWWVLSSRKSSCQPSWSTPRTRTTACSTREQETVLGEAQADSTEADVEACLESWCTLRSLLTFVSAMCLSTLRAHRDVSATRPATAQTAVARYAVAVDTTYWNRHTVNAAIADFTGAATCFAKSVVSPSGWMCASRSQIFQRQLPLRTQDSRWRACPFARCSCSERLFCSMRNSPRESAPPFPSHQPGSVFSL